MPSRCIGSIASSGKPPLPQIARTPYCAPSGSVKRTIRALVVVPMQTFSYLPSPTFRTPGAVWSRNAPRRSIGGSTPWSKIRICVRSRRPMMWPCTTTSSPARSFRISCSSAIGNVTSWTAMAKEAPACTRYVPGTCQVPIDNETCLELPVVVDGAVGADVRGRAAGGPALVVDRDGVERHVRVRVLDVAVQHRHVAAEPHGPDAGLVQQLEQLLLELRDVRIGIARADRPCDRLLREVHRVVRGAADADADDSGRARLAARSDDRLEHELLDPLHPVGGDAHLEKAHVLRARALRHALHVEPVPVGDELPVHDRQPVAGVRPGVLARDRVHGVRAQRVLDCRALGAGLQRVVDPHGMEWEVLAYAAGVDGDAGVLADEVALVVCDLHVAQDRRQDALSRDRRLPLCGVGERIAQILRDVLQRPDVEVRGGILDDSLKIRCDHAFAFSAAARPARRPNTQHSRSELPIMRFRPWVPPAISPQASISSRLVSAFASITRPPFW